MELVMEKNVRKKSEKKKKYFNVKIIGERR
jgi:hypothetical protein